MVIFGLLFGGPQENTTSTSPTTTSTASQSSAEPKTIKLERNDQGSDVSEATSPSIENSEIAPASKTSPEFKSKVPGKFLRFHRGVKS